MNLHHCKCSEPNTTIHNFFFFFFFFSVSLYSVQNIAIHRIRLIFDSSNTLVYRLGPSVQGVGVGEKNTIRYTFYIGVNSTAFGRKLTLF